MPRKIVVNACYGGFGLSDKALELYYEKKGKNSVSESEKEILCDLLIDRDDPILVQVVEELGEEANGEYASLQVIEIPDDAKWEIMDYDGMEHIQEICRKWVPKRNRSKK